MSEDWHTVNFMKHTKECDTVGCPNGWLIAWSDYYGMLEPFAQAYKCHTYGFVTNKRMYGDTTGNYWSYRYPEYLHKNYTPAEVELRGEIIVNGYLKAITGNG